MSGASLENDCNMDGNTRQERTTSIDQMQLLTLQVPQQRE